MKERTSGILHVPPTSSTASIARGSKSFHFASQLFDRTTRETLVQFKEIITTFGSRVWPPIPQDTRVREASAYGKTLWEYSPESPAVAGYIEGKLRLGGYRQIIERMIEVINA